VKKLILSVFITGLSLSVLAQYNKPSVKESKRQDKRDRINSAVKQEEEGNLSYTKQNSFGIGLHTNGYGAFYELGRRRSQRFTNIYVVSLSEIKHPKEEKLNSGSFFSNSYVLGKINNFYQFNLGFGQQYILGQKGNRNGIAVIAHAQGGLSLGLAKPYYVDVATSSQTSKSISYYSDSAAFNRLTINDVIGSSGLSKGFSELKVKPGVYVKGGLRFDFGRYNETVSAIEIGLSIEAYAQKIEQMIYNDPKRLFFQGHVAFVFGKRK
jgi:hypothetical protein